MIRASTIIFFLFLSLFLEVTIVTIPLVWMTIVLWYCLTRSEWVFIVAVVSGIFLDMLLVRQIGLSSAFFICLLFCIFLYQKKFQIDSYYFIGILLFLGSWMSTWLLGYTNGVFTGVVTVSIGIFFLWLLQRFFIPQKKEILL